MTINITLPEASPNLRPTITVMGVGGAGGNAVNNMIRSNLEGVDFLLANTDAQALSNSSSENRIQLGLKSTKGLGAGMRPDIGRQAAEEAIEEIKEKLNGSHMVFIAAGMGGGTGTGAAPVIAQLARDIGILTVGVVTKPFHFEGTQRMKLAEAGIEQLQQQVDTLITIPNQNLFRIANEKTTFSDAFKMADDILYAGVRGVTHLMVQPGLINLDFSDIKTVMSEMGKAMMGTAQSDSVEGRAIEAAEKAIANPLIDDVSLKGAKGLIINITGGNDLTLYEVDEAANRIKQEVQEDANIIYGTTCDERLEGIIRVSIVATGIDANSSAIYNPVASTASLSIDNSVYQEKQTEHMHNFSNKNEEFEDISHQNLIKENQESFSNSESNLMEESNSANINDNSSSLEIDIEKNEPVSEEDKSTVRRLSLFDTLNESPVAENENKSENVHKNEPILDEKIHKEEEHFNENQAESLDQSDSAELESSQETPLDDSSETEDTEFDAEESLPQEDFNQEKEEELLDIPTFLRRQAN